MFLSFGDFRVVDDLSSVKRSTNHAKVLLNINSLDTPNVEPQYFNIPEAQTAKLPSITLCLSIKIQNHRRHRLKESRELKTLKTCNWNCFNLF